MTDQPAFRPASKSKPPMLVKLMYSTAIILGTPFAPFATVAYFTGVVVGFTCMAFTSGVENGKGGL